MHVPTHRFAMKDLQGFICGFVVILFLQSASQYYRFSDAIPSKVAAIIGLVAALAIIFRHIFDLLSLYYSMHSLEGFPNPEKMSPFILSILSNIAELGIAMICYLVIAAIGPLSDASEVQWRTYLSQLTDANLNSIFKTLFLLTAFAELIWCVWDIVFQFRLGPKPSENENVEVRQLFDENTITNRRFLAFNGISAVFFFIVYFFGREAIPLSDNEIPYYMSAAILLAYLILHAVLFRDYYSRKIDRA